MTSPLVTADPITVTADSSVRQICPKVGGTVLIFNADITNVAYVGYNNSIGVSNSTVIQPLTYVVMSGDRTLYGFCPTATVILNLTPGGTYQSASPAQIAAQINALGLMKDTTGQTINGNVLPIAKDTTLAGQTSGGTIANEISATGVPLLNLDTITDQGSRTLNAGSGFTFPASNMNQISYELWVSLQQGSVNANPTVGTITLQWLTTGGVFIDQKSYQIVAGPNGTDHIIRINGPAHGGQVQLRFANNSGSATTAVFGYILLSSSRIYSRDVGRTVVFAQNGFTVAGILQDYGVLVNTSPTIGASNSTTRILPLYTGRVFISGFTASGGNDARFAINEAATGSPLMSNDDTFYNNASNANGVLNDELGLGHIQTTITLTNLNATSKQIGVVIYVDESGE
jgi:hypothetical protein